MSLLAAYDAARSSLATNSAQSAILSRNIANVSDTSASRKYANLATAGSGVAYVASVGRAADTALQRTALNATSVAATQDVISTAYTALDPTSGSSDTSATIASALSDLTIALQTAANSPNDTSLATAAVEKARTLAQRLNTASSTVQTVRQQADADIATSVADINDLLNQYQSIETSIVKGKAAGQDVTDDLDRRDAILSSLSSEIGIRTTERQDGSMVLSTDSGAILYDRSPRSVTFQAQSTLTAGSTGSAVFVDGIDVTSSSSPMKISSGKLAGEVQIRDTIATNYQAQIDGIANGLISAFSETSSSSSTTIPGLFTAGTATMPSSSVGLSGSIQINANVDPDQGGDITLLRDGGIGAPGDSSYTSNTTGAAGYSDRLQALVDGISASRSFAAGSGLPTQTSLATYAQGSVSWLSAGRAAASTASDQQSAIRDRATQALSNATGISLDDEMSKLLDLEHAYQASAKLLTTVNGLYDSLFQAI